MPLAPFDYLFTGDVSCPVTFAFAYSEQLDADCLHHSLRMLLEYIPWLGGRLRATGPDSFVFEWGQRNHALLETARSQRGFEELTDDEAVRLVKSADGEPLMAAKLTQTPAGSVLAVSMSHALVDGFSFFLMMSRWAACARGERLEAPPMERLLRASDELVVAATRGLSAHKLLERSGLFWAQRRPALTQLPEREQIHVSQAEIDALIAQAQRDVPTKQLRQNDVLCAWLWRSYGARWWGDQGDPEVYMSCPVDMRRQLGQDNATLFGCTICSATARIRYDELMNAPLGEVALRVQEAVKGVFDKGFAQRIAPVEALRRQHGQSALESVHLRHPRHGMLVTNMSRLPLAQLDFGAGAPVAVKLYTEIDSMAAVLPAAHGVSLSVYHPQNRTPPQPTAALD
jgi:NRPS condensation-like uncharacterized protein